jgi:hypothetical protein
VFEEGQGDWRAFADFRDAGYGEGFLGRGEVGCARVAWGVWEEEEAVEGDGEGYYAVDYWGAVGLVFFDAIGSIQGILLAY